MFPGRADPCCCRLSGDAESVVAWIPALLGAGWCGSRLPVPKNPRTSSPYRPVAASFRSESRSVVSDSATPWTAACQASLSITSSQSLLKFMSIESVMPSNHLILCCLLLLPPSILPSIRVFSKESVFASGGQSIGVSASFRMDWLDLLAVQGTLKSLLQHHSSKTSIVQHSALFFLI